MFLLKSAFVALSLSGLASASAPAPPSLAPPIGPVATLPIANAFISPDGYNRSAVLAGNIFPGPTIAGNKGDNFKINVVNSLTDVTMLKTTSIHWHGLFQKGTNWADGVGFVTQCPIASGDSFLYNFNVPDQAGTFWYHSHIGNQYCDGLRGAFVVYDPEDPYKYMYDVDDASTVITLADWYHVPSPQEELLHVPNSTLINGLGRYTTGQDTPLAVINVIQGKRYRFRLIAISCDSSYVFAIDGHQLTVIEADGENTLPLTVDSVPIFASQRYSIIVNANQTVDNYWIRANPSSGPQGTTDGMNSAIFRYLGAPLTDPTTNASSNPTQLNETSLSPRENPAAPGNATADGADVLLTLDMGFNFTTGLFEIDGVPFEPPSVPVLLQILSGTTNASDLLPAGSIIPLPLNKVIQIIIPGGLAVGAPHPFHLHGHSFSVIRSAGSSSYNYVNPVRRDVVNTGQVGDEVTIRFVTDNAGPWFLHCHIDWHLNKGLAVVLAEDIPGIKAANPVPPDWQQLCPIYDKLTAEDIGGIVPSS